jgi:hypothetical protein
MTQRLVRLRKAFELVIALSDDPENCTNPTLQPNDWAFLVGLNTLLQKFYEAQIYLEGQNYTTASVVLPFVFMIRMGLKNTIGDVDVLADVKTVAETLKKDFESRWGNGVDVWEFSLMKGPRNRIQGFSHLFLLATALDPYQKKQLGKYVGDDVKKIWAEIRRQLIEMNPVEEEMPTPELDIEEHEEDEVEVIDPLEECLNSLSGAEEEEDEEEEEKRDTPESLEGSVDKEIKEYKKVAVTDSQRCRDGTNNKGETIWKWRNPLSWWRDNSATFPLLAKLARRKLCVQATSAASERVFSTAGRIVSGDRCRLSTDSVEILTFLKSNWEKVDAMDGEKGVW